MANSDSQRWLQRQRNDSYAKQAKSAGYRSRAAYKLLELQQRDKLFAPGMHVVDLGAAPGGWSQVATKLVTNTGLVIAVDILPIAPIAGVEVITGDFQEQQVLEQVLQAINNSTVNLGNHPAELNSYSVNLGKRSVDLVISDMAPNFSGVSSVDLPKAVYLAEIALDLAQTVLKPGGSFLVKLFQGDGFELYVSMIRKFFNKVLIRKPKASRSQSSEVYLVAREYLDNK